MHTPAESAERRNGGLQAAVHQVADHARALVRLELELAATELKRKTAAVGIGIGLLVVGVVLALFALGFLLATIAAALANVFATWLALLIVGGALLLVAVLFFGVGASRLKRGVPPVPEQAIAEAKLTGAALKGRNGG